MRLHIIVVLPSTIWWPVLSAVRSVDIESAVVCPYPSSLEALEAAQYWIIINSRLLTQVLQSSIAIPQPMMCMFLVLLRKV